MTTAGWRVIAATGVVVLLTGLVPSHSHAAGRPSGKTRKGKRTPGRRKPGGRKPGTGKASPAPTGMKPLSELAGDYKGEDGGLYGGGRNEPPAAHLAAALAAARNIQPLNAEGRPAADGKIVLVMLGMSNTRKKAAAFITLAAADKSKSAKVLLVNASFSGKDLKFWSGQTKASAGRGSRSGRGGGNIWAMANRAIRAAGGSPKQVQAAWILQAKGFPAQDGAFPTHARKLQEGLGLMVQNAQKQYPNLKLVYLSSRSYAGYASSQLNPEPYAYESAFAVRWLIKDQISGTSAIRSPLLLWGPYLWADGTTPRQSDGLSYVRSDYVADGTHPSIAGARKMAGVMLKFFKTDATAKLWFCGQREAETGTAPGPRTSSSSGR